MQMTVTIMLPRLNEMQTKALEAKLCAHSMIFSCEAKDGIMYIVLKPSEQPLGIQDSAEALSMIAGVHLATIAPDVMAEMIK